MKRILFSVFIVLVLGISFLLLSNRMTNAATVDQQNIESSNQISQIAAVGSVVPQNEATLHFQISGKLTSLPFKVGDPVGEGDIIASLDSTQARQAVGEAQANLKSTQSALNLVLDNIHLYQYGNGGFSNVGSANETATQKSQREEAQAAVSAAQDALNSAEQNLSQYSLTAPFAGVLTQEDVTSKGINITPATSFTISDPSSVVFQALVDDLDISNIREGAIARVTLNDAKNTQLVGQVSKIYPDTITTPAGDNVYKVDLLVEGLLLKAKLGTNGTALIQSSQTSTTNIVPSWTVLNNQYIWVMENNQPVLKHVTIGESRGGKTQITGGLSANDKVITNPKLIINGEYKLQ